MTVEHIDTLLSEMVASKASDLYLTFGSTPTLRVGDALVPCGTDALSDKDIEHYLEQILTPDQQDEYQATLELNTALNRSNDARFRVNVFRQQSHSGMVIRRIEVDIPTLDSLHLPPMYGELILKKRGLILLVGPTGSGKSTSLAAMIGHRNTHGSGHIITVEDPIEFVHHHNQCIITQRDVGLDTYSYAIALKNALRQRPDLIVIGEIRDREVMEQAIHFAETSHLCVATLHANNSSQAIERVLGFFPKERHSQILLNLSLNLQAILSQRLIQTSMGARVLAREIMLNRGLIRQLIEDGKVAQIREMIEKGNSEGMHTFDQHLFELFNRNLISEEEALAESDSPANLRLAISTSKSYITGKVTLKQQQFTPKHSDF